MGATEALGHCRVCKGPMGGLLRVTEEGIDTNTLLPRSMLSHVVALHANRPLVEFDVDAELPGKGLSKIGRATVTGRDKISFDLDPESLKIIIDLEDRDRY